MFNLLENIDNLFRNYNLTEIIYFMLMLLSKNNENIDRTREKNSFVCFFVSDFCANF